MLAEASRGSAFFELPAGEAAKTLPGIVVRPQPFFLDVLRIVCDLVGDGAHLGGETLAVSRVGEQRVDPRRGTVVRREVVLEQELAEHDADADVGEGAKREHAVGRRDEHVDVGLLALQAFDDRADRLVDERNPDLFEVSHAREGYAYPRAVDALALLRAEPQRAAIFLDVDGALAPIVERPEDAAVPQETREVVRTLVPRYALVAVVSGRESADAARIVGVPGVVVAGLHGLELVHVADEWRERMLSLARDVPFRVEDKGVTVSLHYRGVDDEDGARARLQSVATRARALGLKARFGRKVLELLPPVDANKGTAVRVLLERAHLRRALYAGDDTTDLDGFAALDGLEVGVRVAVDSPEAPQDLVARADVVVEGPAGLLDLLGKL